MLYIFLWQLFESIAGFSSNKLISCPCDGVIRLSPTSAFISLRYLLDKHVIIVVLTLYLQIFDRWIINKRFF